MVAQNLQAGAVNQPGQATTPTTTSTTTPTTTPTTTSTTTSTSAGQQGSGSSATSTSVANPTTGTNPETIPLESGNSSTNALNTSSTPGGNFSSPDTQSHPPAGNPPANNANNNTSTSLVPAQKHLSSGPAAGIAIGCFIAGIALAALLFLLFAKSRRGKKWREGPALGGAAHGNHSSDYIAVEKGAMVTDYSLPQPAEDRAIISDLSKLRTKIDSHVQSYYRPDTGVGDISARKLAAALGPNTPIPAETLAGWLGEPKFRVPALRFFLAWTILSRAQLGSEVDKTLLPPALASLSKALVPVKANNSSQYTFYSRWRQLTALLSGTAFDHISEHDPRDENIQRAVSVADLVLKAYARDPADPERVTNLTEIIKRGARFGFLLFSQPGLFSLDWKGQGAGDDFVAFPGLSKLTDDNGVPLSHPVVFADRDVVKYTG
ncbi:hypothetical protein EJ06DRAFT_319468 [Trichodelitschia bisporula]|uniref:Uncharacterized protein n=1 Tax=Trichodelitschia bisporula TaxID=703511 RepID=A0A6G1I493_9PEZI|nr:hypothetical protein EJ06DRAFT_319468 [Trichodelitschia bisporula]